MKRPIEEIIGTDLPIYSSKPEHLLTMEEITLMQDNVMDYEQVAYFATSTQTHYEVLYQKAV